MPYPIAAVRGKNFGSPTIPWYLSGGIASANCIAAFKPKGAASLAASYVNLVTPGTNDATAGTAAPTFDTATGWTFVSASNQFLIVGSGALVTAVPLTIAVLFQSNNVTTTYALAAIKRSASTNDGWAMFCAGAAAGDPIRINSVEGGANKTADSSSGFTATTWYTAIAVFSATNARASYLNGGSKGTNTDASTPSTSVDTTLIGCTYNVGSTPANPLDGKIGACAFYNTNLSDAQVLALHNAMAALVA